MENNKIEYIKEWNLKNRYNLKIMSNQYNNKLNN